MGTNTLKSNNIQFPIYNEDGAPFEGLVLRKATYDSVVMSLGDKITGEVVYKDNTLAVTMHEYIEFKNDPDDENEDPVRFSLVNPPTIIREGLVKDNSDLKGMTKYSFEFYHPMYQLSNMPFSDVAVSSDERKYLSENKTFGWIGKPKDYIDKLNKNLQGTEWVVVMSSRFPQDKADTLSEVLSFDNNTIADALKTAYDTWEVPYIIDSVGQEEPGYLNGKRFKVIFGVPSNEIYASETDRQMDNPFVFMMGKGVGLKNNSRNPRNNKIITRIAGSGSENNIPYGYPQIVWYGDQNWDYTIDNDPTNPLSYPIYKGIVGGQYVKLIKHPFTRKNLMPSAYSRSVFNKVSPYSPWSGNVPSYNQTLWQLKQSIQSQYSQESTAIEIEAYETLLEKLDEAAALSSGRVDFSGTQFEGSIYNNGQGLLNGYLQIDEETTTEFEFESVLIESKFESANPSYNPNATLIDYYDAVASQEYPYPNEINPLAPSYEFHEFEDIKPEMDDGQSNVEILGATPLNKDLTPADSWDDTIDEDGNYVQSYFSVDLPVLSFDIYACAAITQEMQINMRSGACIGCTFSVQVDWEDYKRNFYDSNGNFDPNIGEGHPRDAEKYPDSSVDAITVICQKETQTFGTLMPNRYQYPQANDEFVVLGISLPIEYIENAEARLDREMKSYMLENNVYYYDYPLKFDEYFLVNHKNILRQLKPNTIVHFEFAGEELQLFVKQLSIKYDESPLPQYNITLTDNIEVVLNQIGQVAENVEKLGSLISIMRQNYGNNVYAQIASKLSKRDDDTASGLITFLKGILFGNSGLWGIDGQGIAHLNELYVDKLEATVAHFFELIIDKIKSVGGQIIVTAANAEITRVAEIYNSQSQLIGWKCYFPNTDGEKTIYNEFSKGDQVVCASFNQAREGHSQDISNKYYWRLCTDVGVEGNEHFIYLDATKGIASQYNGVPEVGDNIVQLGYNKEWSDAHSSEAASDKEQRKNAIIISAYNHNFLDAGVQAPSFVQYTGIEAFSLGAANRLNVISPSGNSFKGTFTVNSGENIEDILIRTIYKESSSRPSTPTYSEGSIPAGWSTTPPDNATNQIWASVLQKNGNTYSWGTPVKWNGMDGRDGQDGQDGRDGTSVKIDTTRTYVRYSTVTNSPIQPSVATFTLTAPPPLSQGDYLWSMSQTAYIGVSDVLRSFSVSRIGVNGTGIQITSTQITYKTSNSGTVTPTSGWSSNIPSDYGTEGHEYLWTKTVVTYSDETSTTSYSVSHYGRNGADGDDGTDSIVYKLTPQQESALVDKNKTLTLTLTYNLWKYIGDSATQISFSGFTVIYKEGSIWTETPLSISDNTASVITTKQNYTNSPLFYTVILRYGGVEVDRRIVPVTTSANVVFEVGEDSIRSAVTQVSNIKNYFGFNRGILNSPVSGSEACQLYPYGYGMACWSGLNRVYNLGLGTEDNNSTWTLYFEARANSNLNINVNFCDVSPDTINGESVQGQVTLNTSWQVFRCVWSEVMSDVTREGLNGYIDFEQSGTSLFYVRKICLVKGVKPMLEFVKADEDLTYSGGLQNFQWNIGATLDSQKFMGMNVYKNPCTLNNPTVSYQWSGSWTKSGNTYTSNTIGHGEKTIERINVTTGRADIKIRITAHSESGYDFVAVGKANTSLASETASTIKQGSSNILEYASGDGVTKEVTLRFLGNGYFELIYAKDSSTSSYGDYGTVEIVEVSIPYMDFFNKTIDIKNKTPYTLSFWAKASVDNVVILSYLHESSWNLWKPFGTLDNMTSSDGACYTTLSREWKHYTVHWYPNVEAVTGTDASKKLVKNIIGCRLQKMDSPYGNNNADIYLAGVTYQEGWVEDGQSTMAFQTSEIKQTADEISSTVQTLVPTVDGLVDSVSAISQTSDRIAATVDNMKIGGRNLVLNGAFNYGKKYWSDWGSPDVREIVTDDRGKKWMHILTTATQYQGYSQIHFDDYGITIDGGRKYTVSIRARGRYAGQKVAVGFHWRNHAVNTNLSQSWVEFTVDTKSEGTLYSATIDVPESGTYNGTTYAIDSFNIMVGHLLSSVQEFYVTDIQFEEGTMPTDWRESIEENHSLIEQTATGIKLDVEGELGECGIDITQNKITLNGNTEVNGSMTIQGTDDGFRLVGNGGETLIRPESIGTYSEFASKSNKALIPSRTLLEYLTETTNNYTATWETYEYDFGSVNNGASISINNRAVSFRKENSGNNVTPLSVSVVYILKVGNTQIGTFTDTSASMSNTKTYTASSGGTLKIQQTVTATFDKTTINNLFPQTSSELSTMPRLVCSQYYNATVPISSIFSLLSFDGMAFNFGSGNVVYFGNEGATLKYGNNGLRITTSGVQQFINGSWVTHNVKKVQNITASSASYSSLTPISDDTEIAMVSNSGQDYKIRLPNNPVNGQVLRVYNIGSKDIKMYANKTINYCGSTYSSGNGLGLQSSRGCECIYYSNTWYVHQFIES